MATLSFNGELINFNIRDFMVALARMINPNATLLEIQEIIFDIFGIRLSEEDITAAQRVLIAAYDFNGDGISGTLEDFGVILGILFGSETSESIEQVCLEVLQISCNLSPGIELPRLDSPTPSFPIQSPSPGSPSSSPTPGGTQPGPTPIPTSTPPGGGETGGLPPANGLVVQITNRDQVDGQPQTTGASVALQATATDEQGRDWSSLIEWLDHQGRPMGSGSNFTYNSGSRPLMETITARVRLSDGRTSFDRVSFTLSTPDIRVAPNVKVLPNQRTQILEFDFDPEDEEITSNEFSLVLLDNENLPTLKPSDVIVGADTRIPPMKIKTLQTEGNVLRMTVELTSFSNLILEGSASFSQQVDLSLNLTPQNRSQLDFRLNSQKLEFNPLSYFLVDLVAESLLKAKYSQSIPENAQFVRTLIATPTSRVELGLFKGERGRFKRSGLRTQWELLSQVYGGFNFTPVVSGELDFGLNPFSSDFGLNYFDFTLKGKQNALLGIAIDGILKLDTAFEIQLFEIPVKTIPFLIGPVPSWIQIKVVSKLATEPSASVKVRGGQLGFNQNFDYDLNVNYREGNWTGRASANGEFNEFFSGNLHLEGALKNQLKIEAGFKLYSIGGPKVGFVPSLTPNVSTFARGVDINPEFPLVGESFSRSDKIPLLATAELAPTLNLDGKLALEVTAFSAKDLGFFKQIDLGRFEFPFVEETLFTTPLPFNRSAIGETTFWLGWKDSQIGFITESELDQVVWLNSCFYEEGEEGQRQISAVIFSATDENGETPLAESQPVNITITPPEIRCPDLDPAIESIDFPREIEDGQAYPLTVKAGLRDRSGDIIFSEPLDVEIVVLSDNGTVVQSTGTTSAEGVFTTTATLNQNLGELVLGVIVRRTTEFDGEIIVLEDRRTVSARDICDIEPNCDPPSGGGIPIGIGGFGSGGNRPGSGGAPGGGGPNPTPTPSPTPTPLPECEDCSDGFTIGDPHFKTLDGLYYAFHGQGEFWLIKSDDDEIQVQTRQIPVRPGANVTLNAAVATKMGSQRVGFYGPQIRVDGSLVSINTGSRFVFDNGGVLLRESGSRYRLVWPTGEFIRINIFNEPSFASQSVDLEVFISSARLGRISGLLGNFDRNRANDITTRTGQTLDPPVALGDLYNIFGESWRINQSESLFDYEPDQTTGTFVGAPTEFVTSETLDPADRQAAETFCLGRGITEAALLEACIVDVAIGGEAFAEVFTQVSPPEESLELADSPTVVLSVPEQVSLGDPVTLGLSATIPGGLQSIRLTINGLGLTFDQILPQSITGCAIGARTCQFTYPFPSNLLPGTYSYSLTLSDQSNQSVTETGTVEVIAQDQPLALDPGLEAAIRDAINKLTGSLSPSDLLDLVELNAKNRGIQTLQGLPDLPNLESLDVSDNALQNLNGLPPTLPELRALSLGGNQLNDLRGLPSDLSKLEFLGVGNGTLRSLVGLPDALPNLKVLSVNGTGLTSLEGLPSRLPSLELLSLWPNELRSLEGLPTDLPSIQNINISSNLLTDIDPIPNLYGNGLNSGDALDVSFNCLTQSYLESLSSIFLGVEIRLTPQKSGPECPTSDLVDIDGIDPGLSAAIRAAVGKPAITASDLASITELDASYRQIRTLEGMPAMPNLQTLDLEGNELTSLEGLPDLPELQKLFLTYNSLIDLRGYPNLPKLQELDLGANSIGSLAGFNASNAASFRINLSCAVGPDGINLLDLPPNLTELYLGFNLNRVGYRYNDLTQIPAMPSNLAKLQVLILNHNTLSNLEGLPENLSNLRVLDVSRNPLTSLSGLPPVSALPNLSRFYSYSTPDLSASLSPEEIDLVEQELWDYREVAGQSGYSIGGCSARGHNP